MNDTIFIAQNEIINLCQSLKQSFGLSYREIIMALGFAEGRIAQMDYTQATYTAVEKQREEAVKSENTDTGTQADKE